MDTKVREAYSEIVAFLDIVDEKYVNRIPHKLRELFENHKSETYFPHYNVNDPIEKQEFAQETRELIALLYLNYWAANLHDKEELEEIYYQNDIKKEQELKEKYHVDNIINKKEKDVEADNLIHPEEKEEVLEEQTMDTVSGEEEPLPELEKESNVAFTEVVPVEDFIQSVDGDFKEEVNEKIEEADRNIEEEIREKIERVNEQIRAEKAEVEAEEEAKAKQIDEELEEVNEENQEESGIVVYNKVGFFKRLINGVKNLFKRNKHE